MKILLVDDHALFREGLAHVLSSMDKDVKIYEAANDEDVFHQVQQQPDLDLVLLDLNLAGKDGFTVLAALVEQYPLLPVVILSASSNTNDMRRSIDMGAMGYILKQSNSKVMLNAVRLVFEGEVYIPAEMLKQPQYDTHTAKNMDLTLRQQEVLGLLVKGNSNKQIAAHLTLAEATVKMHISAILRALNVNNRTQAAMAVEKLGLHLPIHQ